MLPPVDEARFCRIALRTTDPDAAAAFYDAVLGQRGDGIVPIAHDARARGARPMWLGHVDVSQRGGVAAQREAWLAAGATALGPQSDAFALLRDPGGAILALVESSARSQAEIVWHQLHTADASRVAPLYARQLGWALHGDDTATLARRPFAWNDGGAIVGSIADVAGTPGAHPHWIFFFGVLDLHAALDHVRARGGRVLGPMELRPGVRVAVCDDPQGAAFGIAELGAPPPR